MSCGPCAAKIAAMNGGGTYANYERPLRTPNVDCEMTAEVLYSWRAMLTCIKQKGLHKAIGLTTQEVNRHLGIIQSAINYPDDYCYYEDRYAEFQDTILPLIITNVPECI